MLGRDHLLLSVATVSLVLAPLFTLYPTAMLVAVVGAAIGSLVPDADSPDAAIFHPRVRGVRGDLGKIVNSIGVLFPAFGYPTKYLIYEPSVTFYDRFVFPDTSIQARHRGLLHSLLGLGTATVLTGSYLLVILAAIGRLSVVYLGVFLVAYLVGALLHLLEDSCTRSGIEWNYPFRSWKVRGNLVTTPKLQDTIYQRLFFVVLGASAVALVFLPSMDPGTSPLVFALVGAIVGVVLWAAFARFVARCELVGSGAPH